MSNSKEHYDQVLGSIYSWMAGNLDQSVKYALTTIEKLNITPDAEVVDLGCGHGIYSIAACIKGAKVTAIDNCKNLIEELKINTKNLNILRIEGDLLDFQNYIQMPVAAILCMTDTILHLSSRNEVNSIFSSAFSSLKENGTFLVSIRDYSSTPSKDRLCIVANSDENRILTCLLEYHSATIKVHDIVHQNEDGQWKLQHSLYDKLRITPDELKKIGKINGFLDTATTVQRGMTYISFKKQSI